MSKLEMWALVVGFLLPPVLALVQQTQWSDRLRSVVAFVACLIAGAGTVYVQQEEWDWSDWMSTSLVVLVTAVATFRNFWKPTGISTAIEQKTNV